MNLCKNGDDDGFAMTLDSTQQFLLATTGVALSALIFKHVQRKIDRQPCHQQEDQQLMQQYCELLGVERTATIGEVRKAYYEKAKALRAEKKQAAANGLLTELRIAYEMLALGARYGTPYSEWSGKGKPNGK